MTRRSSRPAPSVSAQENPFLAFQHRHATDELGEAELQDASSLRVDEGAPIPLGTPLPLDVVPLRHDHSASFHPALIYVVGLHGGAGARTLDALLGVQSSLRPPRTVPVGASPLHVLFVARTHGKGLRAARWAAQEWSARALPPISPGLVLVSDGPKPAAELKQEIATTARLFPRTWHMPWVEEWRLTADPFEIASPHPPRIPLRITRLSKDVLRFFSERNSK